MAIMAADGRAVHGPIFGLYDWRRPSAATCTPPCRASWSRRRDAPPRPLLATAFLAALGGGGRLVPSRAPAGRRQGRPRPRPAAPVEPPGVGALGRVEPASRVRKLSQPGGFAITRVERLLVAEGDRVEAGQLLAELSDAAQKDAALAQAEAALAERAANLAKTRAGGRPSEVAAQRARIESLAAQEAIARREAERAERLVPSGAGAFAAADRNRAAAAARAAERAEAEAQLETLSRPRPEDVALAEARVAAAEAQGRQGARRRRARRACGRRSRARCCASTRGPATRSATTACSTSRTWGAWTWWPTCTRPTCRGCAPAPRPRSSCPASRAATGRRCARSAGWCAAPCRPAPTRSAAVDARTVEVRLSLSEEGRAALERRTNMQVQVAIRP
jgi:HlyD family secretion protein